MRFTTSAIICILTAIATYAGAEGRNLIQNPSFENGLAGWLTGNDWYELPKGAGMSAAVIDDAVAHSGKSSFRLDGKGNRGLAMQIFRIRPGKYHLSGWIKTRGLGNANAQVLAEWMSKDNKWLSGTPTPAVTGDSDWKHVEADVESPADARSVHLDLLTNAANSGSVWFDDVSLTHVPASTTAPAPVKFTVESPADGSGELKLDWSGHTPEGDVTDYRVYYSDKPFTSVKLLKPAALVDADAKSASITGLTNGKTYYAVVVAVNIENLALDTVVSQSYIPRDRRAPRMPTLVACPLATGAKFAPAAMLSWTTDPADDDIASFTIRAGATVVKQLPADARFVILKDLPQATTTLTLTATDLAGNVSEPATAQIACPEPGKGASGVSGTVTADGAPLAGATVQVRRAGRPVANASTGADGLYGIRGLADGLYLLQASREGAPASRPVYILTGGGPVQVDIALESSTPWAAWAVTPVAQLFRDTEPPAGAGRELTLVSMTNQRRSAQVAIRPTRDLTISGVRFEPLLSADGSQSIAADNLTYNFVSYVHLSKNSTDFPPEGLVRKAPGDFPDELSDDVSREVKANQTQPIFLIVNVPKGAKAGRYAGRAFVQTALGEQPFDIRLQVLPVQFPDKTRLFCVNWLDWNALAKKHKVTLWSNEFFKVMRIYTKMMREHHQNVIVLPPDLCSIYIEPDKSVTFDWELFDRAAQFFIDEGLGERLCIGHLGGRTTGEWACPTFGLWPRAATIRQTGEATSVTPEQFATALQAHLEKKGWLARTMQHIGDEPIPENVKSYREQTARIHQAAPKLRRIDAIHVPDLKGSLEVWVPELEYFDQWNDGYRKFQKAGDAELWFYIAWCPQGKYPQRLIDTQTIKARTIHWMNYLWDTSGYLHWALEWWDIDVESLAPGDSRIIWPGKNGPNSSLRYEAQREGLEDCEYLFMLEDAYRDAAKKLGVNGFDAKSRPKELGHSVIHTLTDYTLSCDELEAAREQIATEIVNLRLGPALLTKVSQTADKPVKPGDITVEGWTEPGATVTINGRTVNAPGGHFAATVTVSAEKATVSVKATKGGKASEVVRRYRVEG